MRISDWISDVCSADLYNNITRLPRPDLWRSSFAIRIGTNPLVAKGSLVSEPRFKEALDSIIERGGRVIVIDPRRTETARRYEHLPVRPGGDGWLLAGVSRVIIDENLEDRAFLDAHCSGLPTFVEARSEEHTSELQSLMRISYAVICLK